MNQPINNGKSWAMEFQKGSRGEKAIESLGLRCDHLRHDLLAMDADRDRLARENAELRAVVERPFRDAKLNELGRRLMTAPEGPELESVKAEINAMFVASAAEAARTEARNDD